MMPLLLVSSANGASRLPCDCNCSKIKRKGLKEIKQNPSAQPARNSHADTRKAPLLSADIDYHRSLRRDIFQMQAARTTDLLQH